MAVRTRVIVGMLWLASLAAVAVTARAQAPQPAPKPRVESDARAGQIVSGSDVGFRIEGWQGSRPVGTFVVRVDGQWVEPGGPKRVMPITR